MILGVESLVPEVLCHSRMTIGLGLRVPSSSTYSTSAAQGSVRPDDANCSDRFDGQGPSVTPYSLEGDTGYRSFFNILFWKEILNIEVAENQ